MKVMKLIKSQNKFILVNDKEIQINDNYVAWETNYATEPKERWVIYNRVSGLNGTNQKKIISASPDFSLLSEEDCKRIGFIDVEKLAEDKYNGDDWHLGKLHWARKGFIEGFQIAQSLNDNMFSLENINKFLDLHTDNAPISYLKSELKKSLQQTSWDVEVEMDKIPADRAPNGWDEFPKIVNGKIKVTKIL